ncbi:Spy/CpxP family protein refolding chaperone [Pelomonas sp. CA6]|uniref:Spy/CpxP family protein refolding chaperone n=1 Tax=Pelomonas sp. CA6 TaxID=2907999 RepID=UPI001F4BE67C|nr:Spy/CpxP family protein refolding chaperone [Pelomonas sp. CA6]MCH7345917.1 Spy/CpxP family protein refolding chaperone [Pelomonas sp. CA6]
MNPFRRWYHHHQEFHHVHGRQRAGHGFCGRAERFGFPGHGRHGHGERLLERVGAALDLDAGQRERLAELLDQLQRQRRALKSLAGGPEIPALLAGDSFARDEAQRLFDARLDALRAAGPALVAALGDFFDALDFEQQQALRFMLRRLRQRREAA